MARFHFNKHAKMTRSEKTLRARRGKVVAHIQMAARVKASHKRNFSLEKQEHKESVKLWKSVGEDWKPAISQLKADIGLSSPE